jgi:hypothetical protein
LSLVEFINFFSSRKRLVGGLFVELAVNGQAYSSKNGSDHEEDPDGLDSMVLVGFGLNFAVDEIDHHGELINGVLMTNLWFNVINLEGVFDFKNISNVVIGFLRLFWSENFVFFSVTDHESHVLAPVGRVFLSLRESVTIFGHVKGRWKREAIVNNDSTECIFKFGQLHVPCQLSSLAESTEENFGGLSSNQFFLVIDQSGNSSS